MQRRAEIGPAVGKVRFEFDRPAISGDGLVEPLERMQRIAEIAVGFGVIRLGGDRLALRVGGRLVILQFIKCHAEIAQSRRHIRLDCQRAPRRFDGKPRPAGQPQHFTEIGVKQRNLRRQLGGALHMLDRVGKLAVLVRDQAEHVHGFGGVRLRFEHATANRFGFSEPSLPAAALGIGQRLVERHEASDLLLGDLVHGRLDTTSRDGAATGRRHAPTRRTPLLIHPKLQRRNRYAARGRKQQDACTDA